MKRRKEADHQAIVDEMSTPRHASSGCIVSHPAMTDEQRADLKRRGFLVRDAPPDAGRTSWR